MKTRQGCGLFGEWAACRCSALRNLMSLPEDLHEDGWRWTTLQPLKEIPQRDFETVSSQSQHDHLLRYHWQECSCDWWVHEKGNIGKVLCMQKFMRQTMGSVFKSRWRPREVILLLSSALMRPHLEYSIPFWADSELLERAQQRDRWDDESLERLLDEERLRDLGMFSLGKTQGDLLSVYGYLKDGNQWMKSGSFQQCAATEQWAVVTNWNTGISTQSWGRALLWEWQSTGAGCPEEWWKCCSIWGTDLDVNDPKCLLQVLTSHIYVHKFSLLTFPPAFICQQNIPQTLLKSGVIPSHPLFLQSGSSSTWPSCSLLDFVFSSSGGVLHSQPCFLVPFILLHSFCSE